MYTIKTPYMPIYKDPYRLPLIVGIDYSRQKSLSKQYYPPATSYANRNKFRLNKEQLDNKLNLNTSSSKEFTPLDGNMKPSTAMPKQTVKPQRVCSAGIKMKRPESRYKKETMFNKLDLGTMMEGKDFYIPIIRCGNEANLEGIMPECWKSPEFKKE